jgi:hypothetical protein
VLDIEQLNGATAAEVKKEAKKWLDVVENYYQVKPVIYTNIDFYNRYLGSEFDKYPLWIAHYYQPDQPRIKRGWIFWQHSQEGRVNGITRRSISMCSMAIHWNSKTFFSAKRFPDLLLKYCNLFSLRSAHATQLGPGCKKIFIESA